MSMELRGFYSECLDAMWDLQGPLPASIDHLSMMFCCNPRTVRKLLPQLIAMGKLILTAEGYVNPRMMAEIDGSGSSPIRSEFEPNSSGIRTEFDVKVPKNPMNSTRVFRRKKEEEEKEAPARATAFENGRVEITSELASEIAVQYPKARLPEVKTAAAAKLAILPRLSPERIEAIVLEAARWNHRDNDRTPPAGIRRSKCSQEFKDLYERLTQ